MSGDRTRTLYFLRHGPADRSAYTGTDDRLRPLTPEGRDRVERSARFLADRGWEPDLILTSPWARARQTAEITAEVLGRADILHVEAALAGGFRYEDLALILELHDQPRRAVLVGHEPDFSTVVSRLTGGGDLVLKKGGLARVDLEGTGPLAGTLVWLLQPGTLLG